MPSPTTTRRWAARVGRYLRNVGVALSQGANTVLLAGDPDESISGRAGKGRERGHRAWTLAATMIDRLFCNRFWCWEADHCARSIERDEGQAAALLASRPDPAER